MADKTVYTFKNLDFNHFDDNFDFDENIEWEETTSVGKSR